MKIKVFQVNPELDQHNTLFRSYTNAMMNAGQIDPSIYKTVFDGYIKARDLEDVFATLNFNQPVGYNGHSMSVSDVVQINDGDCYFCDSFGFKKLKDFDTSKAEPITGYRMLVIEPHKAPYEMVIPDGLEPLQQAGSNAHILSMTTLLLSAMRKQSSSDWMAIAESMGRSMQVRSSLLVTMAKVALWT